MIYLDDFVRKYQGRLVDDDGAYGNQCVDLIRRYVREVFNRTPKPTGNNFATGYFRIFQSPMPDLFTKVANNPADANQFPPRGSVFVLNEKTPGSGGAGHTGIVLISNKKTMVTFEQNSPLGSPCVVKERNYKYLLGWLEPKRSVDPQPESVPIPPIAPQPSPAIPPVPPPAPVLPPEPPPVPVPPIIPEPAPISENGKIDLREVVMTVFQFIREKFSSRKFWIVLIVVLGYLGLAIGGEMTFEQAVEAIAKSPVIILWLGVEGGIDISKFFGIVKKG